MLCGMTAAWAEDDDFVEVGTTKKLWETIQANNSAKVRLTADFALSDINKDYETYCNGNTFSGILDGNGHTIKGDPVANVRARTYMFATSNGATFKNLIFKGIRVNGDDPNQAIITAKAMNHCVFENITFDNVHTWSDEDNAGSAAGWAQNCTFKDITVKNSDFTVDQDQAGCVVGHALNCSFENIKIEHCESTSAAQSATIVKYGKSGGVVGRSDDCTFNNVKVLGSFIKTYDEYVGGVAGYSTNSTYRNCIIDDQSCVCAGGAKVQYNHDGQAGGIVGNNEKCKIYDCINSALITSYGRWAGGMVGYSSGGVIEGCLNTGMILCTSLGDFQDKFYKNQNITDMTSVTKTYQGKEYVIWRYDGFQNGYNAFGGIAGVIVDGGTISKCVNLGSVESTGDYCAGICAGVLREVTVSDCLSDCYGGKNEKFYGICGEISSSTIKNCLNMTTYKDHGQSFSGENNYSLTTATGLEHTTKTTAAKVKSGEICDLLGQNWEQNIGRDAYPTPTGSKGVYHTRSVSNQYGTVCLPFAVESDDKISYYRLSRKEEDEQGIKLVFEYLNHVAPGLSVLFRATEAKDADTDNPVEICFNNTGDFFTPSAMEFFSDWNLNGTFEQKVFTETTSPSSKNIYYVSGGKIKNAQKTTIAPYRAYIPGPSIDELTDNGTKAKAIKLVLAGENYETTELEFVGDDLVPVQQGGKSYSLMGTEVGDGYRGLVIKNGKKVIQNR